MTTHRKKHVPIRTCVICGSKAPKREMTRIVATPWGTVERDSTGRMAGRGAYMCGDGSCLQRGLKKGRVEHALRAKIHDEDWQQLISTLTEPSSVAR